MTAPATGNRFSTGTWLFLRGLALVHLIAFVSAWTQIHALVGPDGIMPAGNFLTAVDEHLGGAAYWQLPTLCWWLGTDTALHLLCAVGIIAALLLGCGILPGPTLVALWTCYLSVCGAGQIFFNFQWDALLLETTLLACFIVPWKLRPGLSRFEPPPWGRWLLAWLLFRLMFLSGIVKLTSGDPVWANLTALSYHFETQPLPTPLAWQAHSLPAWLLRVACGVMFFIELVVPWFFFAPWRCLRHVAALATIGLMVAIAFTGNYTFFNLLTVVLCLPLLDDAFWRRSAPVPLASPCFVPAKALIGLTAAVVLFTLIQAVPFVFRSVTLPAPVAATINSLAPLRSLNNYGLFMVMTTKRPEIVIEGSRDGRTWEAYEFQHKPGDLTRAPTWVAPHQPRLDWQMWFAALGTLQQNRWVLNLAEKILRGHPAVIGCFAHNPFPGEPPRHIRAVLYDYQFTDAATRRETGRWWTRAPEDFYLPPIALKQP